MTSDSTGDHESADAERVDAALKELSAGNLELAEAILLSVIANTPAQYSNSEESDEATSIKFWDQNDFIHFVTWQQERGLANRGINWIGNAYPRAHYYMGFLCVKRNQFDRAIGFLEQGQALEPTNPKFVFENAQALVRSGRPQDALALYDQVTQIGAHVSARDLAVARRGRGFVLIDMGDLDNAELAFKSSLEIEPGNDVALHELSYIDHLRQGGAATHTEVVQSTAPDISICTVCGQKFDKGVVISLEGMPVGICRNCQRKLTKKWWQFWK